MEERERTPQTAEQYPEPPESEWPPTYGQWERAVRVPWWKRHPVQLAASAISGAVIALTVVALWPHAAGSAPANATSSASTSTVDVQGTLTLAFGGFQDISSTGTPATGDSCAGTGGYNDISKGIAVTVGGQSGQTLALGQLGDGTLEGGPAWTQMTCVFGFNVPVSSGQSLYAVTISHRGTETFTPAQIGDIQLTLGD